MGMRGELFSLKASIGKRTYFFNVKQNRHDDIFLNIVESKKNEEGRFDRHSLIIFEEDIDEFLDPFEKIIEYIKDLNKKKDK